MYEQQEVLGHPIEMGKSILYVQHWKGKIHPLERTIA